MRPSESVKWAANDRTGRGWPRSTRRGSREAGPPIRRLMSGRLENVQQKPGPHAFVDHLRVGSRSKAKLVDGRPRQRRPTWDKQPRGTKSQRFARADRPERNLRGQTDQHGWRSGTRQPPRRIIHAIPPVASSGWLGDVRATAEDVLIVGSQANPWLGDRPVLV